MKRIALFLALFLWVGLTPAASLTSDRIDGVTASVAVKAPVRVATTANITLSGTQTIDGVAVVAADRVLVKNQTTASENGIYVVASTAWSRAPDFDGNRDVVQGTLVLVTQGTTQAGYYFKVTTSNPIVIGTSSISFSAAVVGDGSAVSFLASGSGAVTRSVQDALRYDIPVSVLNFIPTALHDSIRDGTNVTALQTYINAAFAAHRNVSFPCGTYLITGALSSVWSDYISITGTPGCVTINGTGTGYTSMWVGGVATSYNPADYSAGVAISDVTAGASTFTTNLSVAKGDILRITSSDAWYASGRSGELIEVDAVSGTTVTPTRPMFGSYTGANTVAIKQNAPQVTIKDLKFTRNSDADGCLQIVWARNVEITGNQAIGCRTTGIEARFIYGGEISRNYTRDIWYSGTGSSYGLSVATAYDVNIHSNNLYGGRHSLAISNYEPSRYVTIANNTITSLHDNTSGALNVHGGAEHMNIHGNNISGGVDVAANNTMFTRNIVTGGSARATCQFNFEHASSDYTIIEGNVCRSTSGAGVGRSPIWINAQANGITASMVRIAGNQATGIVSFATGGIHISPYIGSGYVGADFTIARLQVADNDAILTAGSSSSAYAFLINDNSSGSGGFTDSTGDTTSGSAVIPGMTSTATLLANMYVYVSAGFATTGPYQIKSVDSATQITLTTTANATVSNITVTTKYYPVITDMQLQGGYYYTAGNRAIGVLNLNAGTRNNDLAIDNAIASSAANAIYVDGARSIAITNGTTVKGGGEIYAANISALARISGVRIFNATLNGGIELTSTVEESIIGDNLCYRCVGAISNASAKKTSQGYYGRNTVSWLAAAPTTGTWTQGDIIWKTGAASGSEPGWVCVTSGTFSSFSDTTGDTDGSTAVITGLTSTSGLAVGEYVTVSAGFASTGPFRVEAINSSSSITVNANSNSAQSNVTIATPDPVFKAMGNLAWLWDPPYAANDDQYLLAANFKTGSYHRF